MGLERVLADAPGHSWEFFHTYVFQTSKMSAQNLPVSRIFRHLEGTRQMVS